MDIRSTVRDLASALLLTTLAACGNQPASDLTIEALPAVSPSLPAVPTIPPPPHPVTYEDQSYSVYGLRRRSAMTMSNEVSVTGYIVAIYQPPECPRGQTCPLPAAPHMWMADVRDEAETGNRLMVVGYAQSQEDIDQAVAAAARRRGPPEPGGIPTDFAVGNRVKVTGRFARISASGFNVSEGLLEYASHQTLEQAPAASAN